MLFYCVFCPLNLHCSSIIKCFEFSESFLVQNPFNITPPNQSDLRNKVNPPTHSKLKSFEFCNQIFL